MVFQYLRSLNLVCILSVLIVLTVDATPDEESFVERYGNIVNGSGSWDYAKKYYMNDEKLLELSTQAHIKSGKLPGEVGMAAYCTRKLEFTEKFQTIEVDLIFYVLRGDDHTPEQPFYFYITKGLRPDCVFYLKRMDPTSRLHRLEQHVCELKIE